MKIRCMLLILTFLTMAFLSSFAAGDSETTLNPDLIFSLLIDGINQEIIKYELSNFLVKTEELFCNEIKPQLDQLMQCQSLEDQNTAQIITLLNIKINQARAAGGQPGTTLSKKLELIMLSCILAQSSEYLAHMHNRLEASSYKLSPLLLAEFIEESFKAPLSGLNLFLQKLNDNDLSNEPEIKELFASITHNIQSSINFRLPIVCNIPGFDRKTIVDELSHYNFLSFQILKNSTDATELQQALLQELQQVHQEIFSNFSDLSIENFNFAVQTACDRFATIINNWLSAVA